MAPIGQECDVRCSLLSGHNKNEIGKRKEEKGRGEERLPREENLDEPISIVVCRRRSTTERDGNLSADINREKGRGRGERQYFILAFLCRNVRSVLTVFYTKAAFAEAATSPMGLLLWSFDAYFLPSPQYRHAWTSDIRCNRMYLQSSAFSDSKLTNFHTRVPIFKALSTTSGVGSDSGISGCFMKAGPKISDAKEC